MRIKNTLQYSSSEQKQDNHLHTHTLTKRLPNFDSVETHSYSNKRLPNFDSVEIYGIKGQISR